MFLEFYFQYLYTSCKFKIIFYSAYPRIFSCKGFSVLHFTIIVSSNIPDSFGVILTVRLRVSPSLAGCLSNVVAAQLTDVLVSSITSELFPVFCKAKMQMVIYSELYVEWIRITKFLFFLSVIIYFICSSIL